MLPRVHIAVSRLSRSAHAAALLFVAAAAAHAGSAGPDASAILRAEATVSARIIRLGDVAEIAGHGPAAEQLADVEVGPAPLPGRERSVSADYVRIRLRQHRLDTEMLAADSADTCRITRAAQEVSADRILETAGGYLNDRIEPGEGRLVLEPISRPRPLVLPDGDLALKAGLAGGAVGSIRRVTVTASVDGAPGARADVTFRVRRFARVAVASAAIPRGESLDGHITWEERDLTGLSADVFLEGQMPAGYQAVRPISAGSPVTRQAAAPPPVIRRGDAVTMRARTGGIVVSAPAEALEDGRPGEIIRVRNANSHREGRARVLDAKTVEAPL